MYLLLNGCGGLRTDDCEPGSPRIPGVELPELLVGVAGLFKIGVFDFSFCSFVLDDGVDEFDEIEL